MINHNIIKNHSNSKISIKNLWLFRKRYIQKVEWVLWISTLIKVFIWQRRVWKSFILLQVINFLINKKNILKKNILYLSFEDEDLNFIRDKNDLKNIVDYFFKDVKWEKFIFLDEIQEIEWWEKLVNSYRSKDWEYNIFISWSNSKMLSWELSTYLSWRYIEFEIFPFSFSEFLEFFNLEKNKENFLKFLNSSGFSEIYNFEDKILQTSFIKSLKDTIILRDLVKRYKIKEVDLIDKIFLFLINNIWNSFSLNSIRKKLLQEWIKISVITLWNYLRYFEEIFVFYWISRFDLHWKKILEWEKKYYLNDLWFLNFLFSWFEDFISKKLENYVFNCLKSNWYTIYVWKLKNLEIDFVAEKNDRKIYIQVAYLLSSKEVIEREYWNLRKIKDSFEKIVISLDDIKFPIDNYWIKHFFAYDLEWIL